MSVDINAPRTATLLVGVKPTGVVHGKVYRVSPAIPYEDSRGVERETEYVTASIGLSTILGDGNEFAVFASDAAGKILSWLGPFSEREGPAWCIELDA